MNIIIKKFMLFFLVILFSPKINVFAGDIGSIGFFGGTSEGKKLPKTTDILLDTSDKLQDISGKYIYKELIFLGGKPEEFEGIITVKQNGKVENDKDSGSYTINYKITSNDSNNHDVDLKRNITFKVNYRKEDSQVIKDYTVTSWSENITTPEGNYKLDSSRSKFEIGIIEDKNAGVNYYKGNASQRAVYTNNGDGAENNGDTILEGISDIYGYDSAWSNTETHKTDYYVYTDNWQMHYQVRPTVSVNKNLNYSQNEPNAISFEGNYREIMQNKSGISYSIFLKPQQFNDIDDSGSVNIASYNNFEQLIAPDLSFLKGHFAETDIKKLFAMKVFTGNPIYFKPDQIITRGEFVTSLVNAIKLPIEDENKNKKSKVRSSKKKDPINVVFPDVLPDRKEYKYIISAFNNGLIVGRNDSNFYIDSPIDRQEAVSLLVRSLGLEHLGFTGAATTSFVDDKDIDIWAKKEIQAAYNIGLISEDENGKFNPKSYLSKAEAAAILNALISYMRENLVVDYTDRIINYPS